MIKAALIPLRGGSKSIPLKNIKTIAGKPLCAWVISAAIESNVFDTITVSTDDDRIAVVVKDYFPTVQIVKRPVEIATDTATTESVMLHFASQMPFDMIGTFQATSPLTTASDIRNAYDLFLAQDADSLLTATRVKRFFWSESGMPLNYDPQNRPMRQAFRGTLMENGAFYFTKKALLLKTGCRLGGHIVVHEMDEETAVELDEPQDWVAVESVLLKRSTESQRERLHKIRYFFFDVDGTLTDSAMYYSDNGEVMKRFSTRDGFGMRLLREKGIEPCIISSEESKIVSARARKLGIEVVYTGVNDKERKILEFCEQRGIDISQIGFMGDDLNDLHAMQRSGFSACPNDAVVQIRIAADYICAASGGNGAVREVCDMVVQALSLNLK